jgi:ElaB/YqjD/DUF883 family membrane-anchored ribosome-binding protein
MESSSSAKITDALHLLEEAAKDKKDELKNLLTGKYETLKNTIIDTETDITKTLIAAKKKAFEAALQAKDISEEKIKKVAQEVDEQVHENPWPYIGGVALGALLIGYILGRNR